MRLSKNRLKRLFLREPETLNLTAFERGYSYGQDIKAGRVPATAPAE